MLSKVELALLGTRLKELRLARGVTAAQVAREALGYSEGSHVAVTRLERCLLPTPRTDHLKALASYYGVQPAHLFADRESGVAPAGPARGSAAAQKLTRSCEATTLAQRIRHVREELELSTSEFASELSRHGALILAKDVERWEAGEGEPNPVQLRAAARLTERSEGWFTSGVDVPAVESPYQGVVVGLGWTVPASHPV